MSFRCRPCSPYTPQWRVLLLRRPRTPYSLCCNGRQATPNSWPDRLLQVYTTNCLSGHQFYAPNCFCGVAFVDLSVHVTHLPDWHFIYKYQCVNDLLHMVVYSPASFYKDCFKFSILRKHGGCYWTSNIVFCHTSGLPWEKNQTICFIWIYFDYVMAFKVQFV